VTRAWNLELREAKGWKKGKRAYKGDVVYELLMKDMRKKCGNKVSRVRNR